MTEIPLARAIAELRAELQQAILDGAGEPLRFELDTVDLELQVTMTARGAAEAKVGLWSVLTAGTSADYSRGSVHKLTLKLSPRHNGDKPLIGDRSVPGLPPPATPDD
ncbi:hypothetical protein Acy02nite_48830 [Actinoplanes cyaneus]|uniref:Trypsin-co-occurring domain-containing protein n=1 Tax=Actinoplanes cyaneus TaxID=52696 RepID=A0A919IKN2_9ACTN|nr:trypco2 family protein [Actinoplanes cyaneus]MCW2143166.1 hypothetical protein [Actinoplanes cyaneus]GID67002.1 hypothetical protein Acy02nite_48830 [Actinoplanes cyaneus]